MFREVYSVYEAIRIDTLNMLRRASRPSAPIHEIIKQNYTIQFTNNNGIKNKKTGYIKRPDIHKRYSRRY